MKFKLKPGHGRSDVGSIVLDPEESPEYETWDADEIVNLRSLFFVEEIEVPAKDVIASLPELELRAVKNVRAFDSRPSVIAAAEAALAERHQKLLAESDAAFNLTEEERLALERAELEARLEEIAEREAELADPPIEDEEVDA